jgi:four helix bundle protein
VEWVYNVTKQLPGSEQFGLTSQMRTAAVSVPTNIVEGTARNHQKKVIQFCYISPWVHSPKSKPYLSYPKTDIR